MSLLGMCMKLQNDDILQYQWGDFTTDQYTPSKMITWTLWNESSTDINILFSYSLLAFIVSTAIAWYIGAVCCKYGEFNCWVKDDTNLLRHFAHNVIVLEFSRPWDLRYWHQVESMELGCWDIIHKAFFFVVVFCQAEGRGVGYTKMMTYCNINEDILPPINTHRPRW